MSLENTTELYNRLAITKDEQADMSELFSKSIFKKICAEIIRIKKDDIIESVETQGQLDLAKLTLIGNREIFEIFEKAHKDYTNKNKDDAGEVESDEIIESII